LKAMLFAAVHEPVCGLALPLAGPSDQADSPHPSFREGHHSTWVELELPPIGIDPERLSCCCRGWLPGPPELGAIDPYAVHDDGQPTGPVRDASAAHVAMNCERSRDRRVPYGL